MQLFKKILLSLFPDEIVNQPISPASFFVSFISSKQFFSVINRKIVENYKLNLFDISLDSFDVKIGFGNQQTIKLKDIDTYYSYAVVANFNWYRFLNSSNIANVVTMISSKYIKNIFKKHNHEYFKSILLCIYLSIYLFSSRLKVFPYQEKEKNYNWFIELFFNFYKIVLIKSWYKYKLEEFNQIKLELLKNIQLFMMLFYLLQKMNNIHTTDEKINKNYYEWLFHDEITNNQTDVLIKSFLNNLNVFIYSKKFSIIEKNIMNFIFPADILIRYIFDNKDIFLTTDILIEQIYDQEKTDKYMNSFLKNDSKLEEFIYYLTDYKIYKDNYFKWLKKFIIHKFKLSSNYQEEKEIDEFISEIWDEKDINKINEMKVPDRVKKESALMEKLINFYITFIWWFWVSKWDNFHLRIFKKDLLKYNLDLLNENNNLNNKSLDFYNWLLYNYSKNVFYYKNATKNIREWKQKFNIPLKSQNKETYSNNIILSMFNENFLYTIFDNINNKDIKIYIQNQEILELFKNQFGKRLSILINKEWKKLLEWIYSDLQSFFQELDILSIFDDKDLSYKEYQNIKNSIYNIDFWCWYDFIEILKDNNNVFQDYKDWHILWIFSISKETSLWLFMYLSYIGKQEKLLKEKFNKSMIKKIYIEKVLWIKNNLKEILNIIGLLEKKYNKILSKWMYIDDNKIYLKLWLSNWKFFIKWKNEREIFDNIYWEDIIWFKWFLKNITHYNKRYLIPKDK